MSLKILQRIYFGFDGKPDLYQDYLATWKEQLPGYEIKMWNADNLPLQLNNYTRTMAEKKDSVFLGDFFRWWILKEYGGIYLDADIEIVDGKKFNVLVEELEAAKEYDSFIGIDTADGYYTAHSMACRKGAKLAQFMCDLYQNMGPFAHWRKTCCTAPQLVSLYFPENGELEKNLGRLPLCPEPVIHAGVKIYPKDYFSPMKYWDDGQNSTFWMGDFTENTSICHHYGCSWHQEGSAYYGKGQKTQQQRKLVKDYLVEEKRIAKDDTILLPPKRSKIIRILSRLWGFAKKIPVKLKNLLNA